MRRRHNPGLERMSPAEVSACARPADGGDRRDGIRVFGERNEGAGLGYPPLKPGRGSYRPLLAVDGGTRPVVDGDLCPAFRGTGHGPEGFIRSGVSTHFLRSV